MYYVKLEPKSELTPCFVRSYEYLNERSNGPPPASNEGAGASAGVPDITIKFLPYNDLQSPTNLLWKFFHFDTTLL